MANNNKSDKNNGGTVIVCSGVFAARFNNMSENRVGKAPRSLCSGCRPLRGCLPLRPTDTASACGAPGQPCASNLHTGRQTGAGVQLDLRSPDRISAPRP